MNCWKIACLGCAILAGTAAAATAQTFTVLAYFTDTEGSNPYSSLTQGRDGNFYGTAVNGGTHGWGTVFKVAPTGTVTTLYSFCAQADCADGAYSYGALALGYDGNLYGTTQNGGANGLGVVFRITPGGAYTVLHSFGGADGSGPDAGVVLASDGNFYGTTSVGGMVGAGTVFRITPSGTLTTLHSFDAYDGYDPFAPLVQGTDGDLYGTTAAGGTNVNCYAGCGTVFKITLGGGFTSLHVFQFTDGGEPFAPLVQASNGAFYGTTYEGGDVGNVCEGGCGTIFKISSGGSFASVYKFHFSDGGRPSAGLVQATDGKLYGQSPLGGLGDAPNIFALTLPATLSTVYSFSSTSCGGGSAALIQGTGGELYDTCDYYSAGGVYSLGVGLGPFVSFVVPAGKVGQTAQILGQGFTGTTSVTFNGVAATKFSVVSDTYMTAVVPSGASTGPVVVTTPGGAPSSNMSFRIID